MNERKCPVSRQEAEALFAAVQNSNSRDYFAVSGANALAEEFGMSCRISAHTPAADDAKDAERYRLLREEGRDLNELLHLVVGINPGGHGTHIRALRHTHYLDAAIDAIANERGE